MNPKVDLYLENGCGRCKFYSTPNCKVNYWRKELKILREILLNTGLIEELKWGQPVYTYKKSNLVLLTAFKESCAISFFKGTLLKDEERILEKPGENSQTVRYIKFTNSKSISSLKDAIKNYIYEAIEIEKAGIKVNFKTTSDYSVAEEFEQLLLQDSQLKKAFENLTPGRQRGYLLHFSSAKQTNTRLKRIEKCIPSILKGIGFNEK